MSLELIGSILGAVGAVVGTLGALRALLTEMKFKQVEKEKAQPNIDIDFKYQVKEISGKKFVESSVIFDNIGEINTLIKWFTIQFQPVAKPKTKNEEKECIPIIHWVEGYASFQWSGVGNSTWYNYEPVSNRFMGQLMSFHSKKIREILKLDEEKMQKLLATDDFLKYGVEQIKTELRDMEYGFDIREFIELLNALWYPRIPRTEWGQRVWSIDEYIRGFQLSKNEKKQIGFCFEYEGEGLVGIMAHVELVPLLRKDATDEDEIVDAISNCFHLKSLGKPDVEDWMIEFDTKQCEKIIKDYKKKKEETLLKKDFRTKIFRNKEWFFIYI